MNRERVLEQLRAAENPTMVAVVVTGLIDHSEELEAELHLADAEINHLRAELHEHHLVRDPRCDLCAGEVK